MKQALMSFTAVLCVHISYFSNSNVTVPRTIHKFSFYKKYIFKSLTKILTAMLLKDITCKLHKEVHIDLQILSQY